jgi:hypothetical protein
MCWYHDMLDDTEIDGSLHRTWNCWWDSGRTSDIAVILSRM